MGQFMRSEYMVCCAYEYGKCSLHRLLGLLDTSTFFALMLIVSNGFLGTLNNFFT